MYSISFSLTCMDNSVCEVDHIDERQDAEHL